MHRLLNACVAIMCVVKEVTVASKRALACHTPAFPPISPPFSPVFPRFPPFSPIFPHFSPFPPFFPFFRDPKKTWRLRGGRLPRPAPIRRKGLPSFHVARAMHSWPKPWSVFVFLAWFSSLVAFSLLLTFGSSPSVLWCFPFLPFWGAPVSGVAPGRVTAFARPGGEFPLRL